MRSRQLSARQRAAAGNELAQLGDPRFRPDAWYLPDEPLLGFVEIPAGPFLIGSNPDYDPIAYADEIPQHQITLPSYYIGRYPATGRQFRAFIDRTGHKPENEGSLYGPPNHPVVWLGWLDGLKYCEWLTARLCEWAATPEPLATRLRQDGWGVTLPSEPEWEKAARGTDGRTYPWGNGWDATRCNSGESGVQTTAAIGAYPQGASPYGLLAMSGNVFERTRSRWGTDWGRPTFRYPYRPDDGRKDREASPNVFRLLRGGAFDSAPRFVRCAFRLRNLPNDRVRSIGFRVVMHH
jgi:formylglycine-generating enzyme required for sulfatase activity